MNAFNKLIAALKELPPARRNLLIGLGALVVVVLFAIVFALCSGGDDAPPTTTTTTGAPVTTTTAAPTTTAESTTSTSTTVAAGPVSQLNGLPTGEDTDLDRRVVAVKVDNHPDARPQSGLQEADAVMELIVEGGLSRFIALFHESDSEYVGPVRSVRPTDPTLVRPLDAVLQISGGQPWVQNIVSGAGVNFLSESASSTFRISGRSAPHNLYASTPAIRELADERGWPDEPPADGAWFTFGTPPPADATAETVTLDWSSQQPVPVVWRWDGEQYLRSYGETPHEWVDAEGERGQIATDTLVVLTTPLYTASGSSGSSVPALETTGTGTAYVFVDGSVIEGTWQRDEITEAFSLTTADGATIELPAGRLWVSVFPDSRPVTWE